jgi:dephospho-CoA kinase
LRPIVVVDAPIVARIERTVTRDGGTEEDVLARVRAQMPLEEKVRRADYVIDNGGPPETLSSRADEVLDAVCERLNIKVTRYPRP